MTPWNMEARYMTEMTSSLIGIDHMAIMYSVPFGLLGWGYVTAPQHSKFHSTIPASMLPFL